MERKTVWIVGMMGVGKSTVADLVARRLGRVAIDTDERIAAEAGRSVPEIFSEEGEAGFRARERAVIDAVAGEAAVVSLGGGAMAQPGIPERLRETGRVVYLSAEPADLAARIGDDPGRPLLAGLDAAGRVARLGELLEARAAAYARAHAAVDTTGLPPEGVAGAVVAVLGGGS